MAIKPITPDQVGDRNDIPDAVIEAFNSLITENMHNGRATFNQDLVVARIQEEISISREKIFSKGYLNIEPIYEKAGWTVTYDKPGWDESYTPYFTFSRSRR